MNMLATVTTETGELSGLIARAANSLASATTAAEVLDARDEAAFAYDQAKAAARLAKAKGAHDEITAKVHRSQADALEILSNAKRRLADEYDAAQERGEVAGHGGKRGNQHAAKVDGDNVATVADIGLTRPEIFEAREIKAAIEANPNIIRRVLDEILDAGEEPTKARLRRELAPVIAKERKVVQAEKKERRHSREIALAQKIEALPSKRYGVILADPEWRFEPYSRETGMDRAPDNHYPTSETALIADRDVASIAAADCVLFLWATVPMLLDAIRVMGAWGFEYKSHLIWAKERSGEQRGTGYWFSVEHELLLVGTRGNVPAPALGTQWRSVITSRVGEHSEKPEVFLELVEDYFPNLPKIELNRRGPARNGWDAWGYEASTKPEDDSKPAAPKITREQYDDAMHFMSAEQMAGRSPNIYSLGDALVVDRDTACALFDAVIDKKRPAARAATPAAPAAVIGLPPAPGRNAPVEFHVGGLKKGLYARWSVSKTDSDRFNICTDHWLGYTGGGGPPYGDFLTFQDALSAAMERFRAVFARVIADTSSACAQSHKAAARSGIKWLDKQALAWGLASTVATPTDDPAPVAHDTPLELYIAERSEGGAA